MLDSDPCFPNFSEESLKNEAQTASPSDSALIDDVPAIWCLACQDNLVFLGTGTGRLEIWDAVSGFLKVKTF